MAKYTYFTDGAATMLRKDGKYLREAGGWAFVLLVGGQEVSSQSGGCPLTTNNEMELYAIYASMKDFLLKDNHFHIYLKHMMGLLNLIILIYLKLYKIYIHIFLFHLY